MLLAILLILFPVKVASKPAYECYDLPAFEVTVGSEAVFEAERTVAVTHTDLYTLISQYDWNVEIAYAVMMAESNGVASAVNWNDSHNGCVGSYGLFQIACLHVTDTSLLFDPAYNVQRAYELWSQSGWRIWGAFTDQRYLQYI